MHGRRERKRGKLLLRKQSEEKEEGISEGGANPLLLPNTQPKTDGRMFPPAMTANGRQGAAPSLRAGPARGSVWLNLKSVFTGWIAVVERSFLSSHGCADAKDEDPGVARQL